MLKYLSILALGLCACGGGTVTNVPAPQAPVASHSESVVSDLRTEADSTPVDVELPHGGHAQAVRCTSELDCMQKLVGLCPNGYNGGQTLSDGQHTVGTLFRCITDAEKAQAARDQAEEQAQRAEFLAARAAAVKAQQEEATKKTTKPTHR